MCPKQFSVIDYHGFDDDRQVATIGTHVRNVSPVSRQISTSSVSGKVEPADVDELRVMCCREYVCTRIYFTDLAGMNV